MEEKKEKTFQILRNKFGSAASSCERKNIVVSGRLKTANFCEIFDCGPVPRLNSAQAEECPFWRLFRCAGGYFLFAGTERGEISPFFFRVISGRSSRTAAPSALAMKSSFARRGRSIVRSADSDFPAGQRIFCTSVLPFMIRRVTSFFGSPCRRTHMA